MLDSGLGQTLNDLYGLLRAWNTGCDTETLNRQPLLPHLLPQRELEAELSRINIESVKSDTDTRRYLGLDFGNFGVKSGSITM